MRKLNKYSACTARVDLCVVFDVFKIIITIITYYHCECTAN